MQCPIDQIELIPDHVAGHAVQRCVQCAGVFYHGESLRAPRAQAALAMHAASVALDEVMTCPRDGATMKALTFQGVPLCACRQCGGLWLAAGQFRRLLDVAGLSGQESLALGVVGTPASSSSSGSFDGVADLFELTVDLLDLLSKFTD